MPYFFPGRTFDAVYPPSQATTEQRGLVSSVDRDNLNRLAAFGEIPNWRKPRKKPTSHRIYRRQTLDNLGKKSVGWQDRATLPKKIRNVFLGIFFLAPSTLIYTLFRTPINIIRLFTNFAIAITR